MEAMKGHMRRLTGSTPALSPPDIIGPILYNRWHDPDEINAFYMNIKKFVLKCIESGNDGTFKLSPKDIWEIYVINYTAWNETDRNPMRVNPKFAESGWHRTMFDEMIRQVMPKFVK